MVTVMDNVTSTNLSVTEQESLTAEQEVLDILTWVSCGLTCLSCLCTVMIYIGYRLLQSSRCMLKISFLAMLSTTEAFFVAGMKFTQLTAICTGMAVILHFSCIATFSWLLCYILFLGNELKGGQLSFFLFGMIGYVVPGCIVGITLIWHYTDYRDRRYCWISSENYLDWTLKGPIVSLSFVCCVILIHVLVLTLKVKTEKQKTVLKLTRSGVRACCIVLPVVTGTWILGSFTITGRRHHPWLQATFTAFNLLLGLVIFLFMCLFNGEVSEVRRIKQMGSVGFKKRKSYQTKTGGRARRGINLIDTARDVLRTQTPQLSPRRNHYRPLSMSTSDVQLSSGPAAPLASVEDMTMGSTEILSMTSLQMSGGQNHGDAVNFTVGEQEYITRGSDGLETSTPNARVATSEEQIHVC